jgi:hypothetical protein
MWTALGWTRQRIPEIDTEIVISRKWKTEQVYVWAASSGWGWEEKGEESPLAQPHVKINGPNYLEMAKKMMLKTFKSSSVFGDVTRGVTHEFSSKLAEKCLSLKCL